MTLVSKSPLNLTLVSKDPITVVIPTLNEEEAIGPVIDELYEAGYKNILVIDGHSTDNTVKIAESKGVKVVQQNGQGKTAAFKTALDYVTTSYIVVMDGDFTYCAKDIERLFNASNHYVQVLGVRERENISSVHRFGNRLINQTFNLLFGVKLSDVCSGMYLLKTDVARELELQSKGFRTEVEVLAQTAMDGKVTEVPISYRPRIGQRKLSTWRSGFAILSAIFGLARRYNPIFFFSTIAGLSIIPASLILAWVVIELLFSNIFYSWWATVGLFLLLLASQALTVSTISLLLKRTEKRILRSLSKE